MRLKRNWINSPHVMIMGTSETQQQQERQVSRHAPRHMSHSHHHRAQLVLRPSKSPELGIVMYFLSLIAINYR